MTDKEIHDYLVKMIGVNYHNYPKCVEFYIKLLNYRKHKSVDIRVWTILEKLFGILLVWFAKDGGV